MWISLSHITTKFRCLLYHLTDLLALSFAKLVAVLHTLLRVDAFRYSLLCSPPPTKNVIDWQIWLWRSALILSHLLIVKFFLFLLIAIYSLEVYHDLYRPWHQQDQSSKFFSKSSVDVWVQPLSDEIIWIWEVNCFQNVSTHKVDCQEIKDYQEPN
jgi:hypothetical protein